MTSHLAIIQPHQAGQNVDLVENYMLPSFLRSYNLPRVDVPGRDDAKDSLVSPLTAMARYNPYNGVLTGNYDNLNNFAPSPFTQPETVNLYLTNTFGSGGGYLTAPLYESAANDNADSVQWNRFLQTPLMRKKYEFYGLGGAPTATQLLDMFERDSIPKDFKMTVGFDRDRPTSADFEQSLRVTLNPGSSGAFQPGQACQCKFNSDFGAASIQAIALSSANFERLYFMMRDVELLGPIEALIVFEGRSIPCMCSWITPGYANLFVGYTQGMNYPAIKELDMRQTLNTVNEGFINKLLGAIVSNQELAKRTQHRRFMGPAIGITLPPMDPAMDAMPGPKETAYQLGTLSATNYLKIDGASLFGDLNTAAAAHQLSRPRAKDWNDDMYVLTGMDARYQVDLAKSGAVSTGLDDTVNIPLAMRVIEEKCARQNYQK